MKGFWTCQRTTRGVKCGHRNANRHLNCRGCGKRRPERKTVRRQVVLPYEAFVALNGGEHCGICGRGRPESGRRLHRDHDHKTGRPRGLLCFPCNRQLRTWASPEWLRAAADYLERAEVAR